MANPEMTIQSGEKNNESFRANLVPLARLKIPMYRKSPIARSAKTAANTQMPRRGTQAGPTKG